MGCCSSSPIEDLRAPLLAPSSAQQPAAAAESYPPSLNYNSSSSASASTSSSYHHPPVPTSVHAQHQHNASAKSEAAPADNELDAKAQTTEENESDEPSLTASGLRVIDAPRPEGATEHMTKEEEFEFYKKKMEQLNREKEDTNARFLKEEREKQKLLDKQHKKPSLLTFFKGGEEEEAEFAIGAPQGFKHESHIGWTPEGGFDIFNVPNEWKKLMSKAGVTEEQMQDKETAMFIVSFVASTLGNQQGGQAAAQAPAAHPVQAEERREGEAEVQVSPSENSQPAEQERPGEEEEESIPSAPPAPLAPAPAQPALGGSSAPPPPPVLRPSVAEEGSSGDMFSAIRGGVALKKVAALPDVKNLSVQEEDSIAGALARALQSRRFAIREEEEEPEEEDNGEWDD